MPEQPTTWVLSLSIPSPPTDIWCPPYWTGRPLPHLPDELLLLVFKALQPSLLEKNPCPSSLESLTSANPLLLPSHTCRRWRRIASSMLWQGFAELIINSKERYERTLQALPPKDALSKIKIGSLETDHNEERLLGMLGRIESVSKLTVEDTGDWSSNQRHQLDSKVLFSSALHCLTTLSLACDITDNATDYSSPAVHLRTFDTLSHLEISIHNSYSISFLQHVASQAVTPALDRITWTTHCVPFRPPPEVPAEDLIGQTTVMSLLASRLRHVVFEDCQAIDEELLQSVLLCSRLESLTLAAGFQLLPFDQQIQRLGDTIDCATLIFESVPAGPFKLEELDFILTGGALKPANFLSKLSLELLQLFHHCPPNILQLDHLHISMSIPVEDEDETVVGDNINFDEVNLIPYVGTLIAEVTLRRIVFTMRFDCPDKTGGWTSVFKQFSHAPKDAQNGERCNSQQ